MSQGLNIAVIKHRYVQFIQYVFIFSIGIAPFYFGGERILAWGMSGVMQSVIAIALVMIRTPQIQVQRSERYLLSLASLCLGLVLAWTVLQIVPITSPTLVHPIWGMAGNALDEVIPATIAVSPDEGFLTLIKILIVLLVFFNAKKLYRFKINAYNLVLAIGIIALAYAILGLIWLRYYPTSHVWLEISSYPKNLVSTFVNRNSFAQYLGVASICTLAYITHVWKSKSSNIGSFIRFQLNLKDTFNIFAFSILLFCTLLICLLLTASRGGIYSSLAAYGIFFLAILRIVKNRYAGLTFYFMIVLVAGYLVYDSYSGQVGQRNITITEDYSNRFELYRLVWELIQSRYLTGYGLGGFEAAFRAHMPIDFDPFGIWHRAHNVYLDAAVALGVPAAIGAFFVVITPLIIHILRLLERVSTFSILVVALYTQLSIHSLFDFGLQTGANAITVAALLGASLTQSKRRSSVNQ